MKYLEKSFSVEMGGDQTFRDNWDRTFGKKDDPGAPGSAERLEWMEKEGLIKQGDVDCSGSAQDIADGVDTQICRELETMVNTKPIFKGMELLQRALKAWDLEQVPGEKGLVHVPTGRRLHAKWVPVEGLEAGIVDLKNFHKIDGEREITIAMLTELIEILI